jgi:hypothetical protein
MRARFGNRLAMVVSSTLHQAFARILQAYLEAQYIEFAVFFEEGEARKWLVRARSGSTGD